MAMIEHGRLFPYEIQPDRSVTLLNDGSMSGTVEFKTDVENRRLLPSLGAAHPDDPRLEMYQADYKYGANSVLTLTASYVGLDGGSTSDKQGQTISYIGGQNHDPIETHPDFAELAGTSPASAENDAKWIVDDTTEPESYRFVGWGPNSKYYGLEYYITPSTIIEVTYWSSIKPSLKKRMKIVTRVSGVVTPPDIKNFMLLDTPYRKVGSYYQITEQYLASGPDGWDDTIYKQ